MAKALRILHVFPSFELGGSQRRMTTYLNASKTPHTHLVHAMDDCYDASSLSDHFRTAGIPEKAIPKNSLLSAVKTCRKLLRQINPDLLVTYNWGSIEWVLSNRMPKRCPMIQIQDGFGEDERSQERPKRQKMRRVAYRACDQVIVPSKQLETLARESWGIRDKRLMYIPNGIEVDLFSGAPDNNLLEQYGITPDHRIVGTVARLNPEKNIGRLIEAFSAIENKHTDARLVIVGDGVGMSALKMLAERICEPERVIFTGTLDTPEKIVPAFDVFALSSDTEQMPISVLEAMAASKPVASTDVGDIKDMVANENRSLIAGNEAASLASSLDKLLSDTELAHTIGAANKMAVKARFSLSKMVESYDRVFAEVARKPK